MFFLPILFGVVLYNIQIYGSLSPWGVEMCKQTCQMTSMCSRIVFQVKDLTCCFEDNRDDIFSCLEAIGQDADIIRIHRRPEEDCDKGLRIITTRSHSTIFRDPEGYISGRKRASVTVEGTCKKSDYKTNNYTAFIEKAFEQHKFDVVKCLAVLSLVDINKKLSNGRTPVMLAASYGNKVLFDYLLGLNCDLSIRDRLGQSVLYTACTGGNVQIVKTLVEEKAMDVDDRGNSGGTPIMGAAYFDRVDVCEYLIQHECKLMAVSRENNTAIHFACKNDAIKVVRQLIDKYKFPIEGKGYWERTPFLTAAYSGSSKVVDFLAARNCTLSAVDDKGNNALHLASFKGHGRLVEKLIQALKFDVNAPGERGLTAIALSAIQGETDVFNVLLDNGADPLVKDEYGGNALHLATGLGKEDVIKQLISKAPQILDTRDGNGRTGVMLAAAYGKFNIFKLLVESGANITSTDVGNIFRLARRGGHPHIQQMLRKMRKNERI